jgi:hypothetical protein
VAAHRPGLVQSTPARPVQHQVRWGQSAHHQAVDEPTDFGDSDRDQEIVVGADNAGAERFGPCDVILDSVGGASLASALPRIRPPLS